MLSEIITIPNSGDVVSGTGRPQALKDGVSGGLGQLTDHSDSGQKNFLSVLSKFGLGTVQVPPEETSKLNLKLAESQSADEAATDNPVSGKMNEKSGKGSQISKRLTSVYPKSPGFVMGLLSIPDPQRPDLSVKPDLHSLGTDNEANSPPELIVGGSPPEMTVNDRVPDERVVQTGNPLAATALSGPEGVPVVQALVAPKLNGQRDGATPAPVPSGAGLSQTVQEGADFAQAVQAQVMPRLREQWDGATPAPVPSGAGLFQADQVGADFAQVFQSRVLPIYPEQGQPGLEFTSDSALSGSDGISAVQVQAQAAQKLREQQHQERHSLPIPDRADLNPLTEKNGLGVKGNQLKGRFADSNSEDSTVYEKVPTDHKIVPDMRQQEVKVKSASSQQIDDSVETGVRAISSVGASNIDDGTPDAFRPASHTGRITGKEASQLQPTDLDLKDTAVIFAREGQMEKTTSTNPSLSSIEIRPADQSFQAEILKQVVEKSASTLKSGQSEIRIDLKPESLGHLRLHISMENQQVTVKILAENTQVKEMIERQAYLIKNELQHQGIKVDAVNVDMLISGGSDFASSHHEEAAFRQTRNEMAYVGGQESTGQSEFKEPNSPGQANSRGGYLINYFA